MPSAQELAQTLHSLERKILPHIKNNTSFSDIKQHSHLQELEITRALHWLENKKLIQLKQETTEHATLQELGEKYKHTHLPERQFLNALGQQALLDDIAKKAKLDLNETRATLGLLKTQQLITLQNTPKGLLVKLADKGKPYLKQPLPEEILLAKTFPLPLNTLTQEEQHTLQQLNKRKGFLTLNTIKRINATILPLGKQVLTTGLDKELIDTLTPELLRHGAWKNKDFRRYNVQTTIPKTIAGKHQHYRRFLDNVRQKFVSLGFTEMTGPLVESDFWNMDALFMPQFHSARDIHDAYFVKEPPYATLDNKNVLAVKKMHEHGGAGSTGWRYTFDTQRTRRHLLRTQGTALSARMLASPDLKIPGKYFGIARCFRKDVIDATHLVDFNQTEGIIVEQGLTLKHLFGLLRTFAKEFAGTEHIKLVPGYFPFTEPSVELFAKHPQLGWVELGGAGIFRPEVVTPLIGKDISVIAWGIGIDRLAMFKLGLKDIRSLFSHDLHVLRSTKVI